jgi:hypothetical protein
MGAPTQTPPAHASGAVQALLSLHGAVLLVFTQPVAGLHESVVQMLLSLQLRATPGWQTPAEQASPMVQALPSLHDAAMLVWAQPVPGSQLSLVQTLLSSQLSAGPLTQTPPEHVSLVVQTVPSLHGAVLLAFTQPVAGLQESSVQVFPSLQLRGTPGWHAPAEQKSPTVQALPSVQDAATLMCVHPVAGSQASLVHTLPSSQLGAGPPAQVPPAHVSFVVHALPSLHGAVLLVWRHPEAGTQLSSVQTLLSSQISAVPGWHTPAEQVSVPLQALASAQVLVLSLV